MPREAIVDLPCRVKHDLGDGDLRAGSRGLVNLLRASEVVEQIRSRPRQDGKPVDSVLETAMRACCTTTGCRR